MLVSRYHDTGRELSHGLSLSKFVEILQLEPVKLN